MTYCVKCGARVEDGILFCPECGSEIPGAARENYWNETEHRNGGGQNGYQNQTQENAYQENVYQENTYQRGTYQENTYQESTYQEDGYRGKEYFDSMDVQRNKAMGVLSYIGILVLIPILAGDRRSEYVKFHINQGFALFILSKIVDLLSGNWVLGLHSLIDFGGSWFSGVFDILDLACFILMIVGIVAACKGERKELPIIGQIKIWR